MWERTLSQKSVRLFCEQKVIDEAKADAYVYTLPTHNARLYCLKIHRMQKQLLPNTNDRDKAKNHLLGNKAM